MNTALLDTNILIDLVGGSDLAKEEVARYSSHAISRITWIEFMTGVHRDDQFRARDVLIDVSVFDLSAEVAERTVFVRRSTRLKLPDAIIYATAQVHGLTLVTRNSRDFSESMPGVRIPYIV